MKNLAFVLVVALMLTVPAYAEPVDRKSVV